MFDNPPEREKYVHFGFKRGNLESLLGVVVPMSEKHRLGVFLSCSWYELAREVADGHSVFVQPAGDILFLY
jgi:hypothetical protein